MSAQWFVSKNGLTLGPHSTESIQEFIRTDYILSTDLVVSVDNDNEFQPAVELFPAEFCVSKEPQKANETLLSCFEENQETQLFVPISIQLESRAKPQMAPEQTQDVSIEDEITDRVTVDEKLDDPNIFARSKIERVVSGFAVLLLVGTAFLVLHDGKSESLMIEQQTILMKIASPVDITVPLTPPPVQLIEEPSNVLVEGPLLQDVAAEEPEPMEEPEATTDPDTKEEQALVEKSPNVAKKFSKTVKQTKRRKKIKRRRKKSSVVSVAANPY